MAKLANRYIEYIIGEDGSNSSFRDASSGVDYCIPSPFATIKANGREVTSSAASLDDGILSLVFEDGSRVDLSVEIRDDYFVFTVTGADADSAEELAFLNLNLRLEGGADEPLACTALALNLQTKVEELPRPRGKLRAYCYPRFGLEGAAVALIATRQERVREAIKKVVTGSPGLPESPIGGAWAMDSPHSRGSYVFNFDGIPEERAEEWVSFAKELGVGQIDFHGGKSFRFGDCRPDPDIYPRGIAGMRAVNEALHGYGILAGLHTYAFFIDKSCPWVTPVPDRRLATDATFSLARPVGPDDEEIEVVESTEGMSAVTGFFVRNSVTLRIDDELVTYEGVTRTPPYTFTGCVRGACGTSRATHGRGAEAHHLKECFGLFAPDPGSTLFTEVIQSIAETYNEGGFDMIYLDALDGEDVLGGRENGWHYGSRFVYELCKRLDRPALMEMSTFHHHLWHVRSRMGAWDHPNRSYKRFIDIHCAANEEYGRMFLPTQLGWWAFKMWRGFDIERTFPDDIEYLCCKAIATDSGLSIMGINPEKMRESPGLARLAGIVREYEELRLSGVLPAEVRERIGQPGREFTVSRQPGDRWEIAPVVYRKHKVESREGWSTAWMVENPFRAQPPGIRIEPLMSAEGYRGDGSRALWDLAGGFERETASGEISVELAPSDAVSPDGTESRALRAFNGSGGSEGAWTKIERSFNPPLDMSSRQGMGLWVRGDGRGEVLNIQLRSPPHVVHAIGEHYIRMDFSGWRYFELIEPEGERFDLYRWPYAGFYSVYRESVDYDMIESLGIWYNNLPPGKEVECMLTPVRALPLIDRKLREPGLNIGGDDISFPVDIQPGEYLELSSGSCAVYGPEGQVIDNPAPSGDPRLRRGKNEVRFISAHGGQNPRANITLRAQGKPIYRT
jgi:hypothetical protein